ncbi:DUF971 domain-containing protein [Leucothrix sargassi]|nr:DUF971 domain-containing protein [Leucothrix sargassi]
MTSQTTYTLTSSTTQDNALELTWSDGKSSRFHFLWLRDNCPTVLHPDTQERVFNQLEVSAEIHPVDVSVIDDTLYILWSEQSHESVFSEQWLRTHAYSGDLIAANTPTTKSWDSQQQDAFVTADYADVLTDDSALYDWMKQLDQDGLIFVDKVPPTDAALTQFAQRIDYQRQTNFGVTFEVKSAAKPINLAYTALALPLHTDLPNYETPPGYQFLHCLSNQGEGGESLFVDGLRVLEELRNDEPAFFDLLATQSIPFRFHDATHDVRSHHPVINLDHRGNIVELKYNAHIADIFDLPEAVMHDYYLAYRELMKRMNAQQYQVKIKLSAGVMAVFDNRRVLHGRTSYEPTSERHLRGCYVDRTEFKSRLRVLARDHQSK